MDKINNAIGCEVTDCMFNCDGKNCTLDHIMVGNACDCGCLCGDSGRAVWQLGRARHVRARSLPVVLHRLSAPSRYLA